MIRVEGLVKKYGSFTAVDGVDLDVAPGEIHGFLGPNGAGKTTTIRIVAGLLRPTAGRVTIAGHDLAREPEAAKAAHITSRCFMPCENASMSSPSQRVSSNRASIASTRSSRAAPSRPKSPPWNRRNSPAVSFS